MDARGRSLDPLRASRCAPLVALLVLLSSARATAQEAAPETLVLLPRCEPSFGGPSFGRLLALELSLAEVSRFLTRELAEEEAAPRTQASLVIRVEASCEVGGRAIISVSGRPEAPSVHQVLNLSEVDPQTRGRAIAVATAEQVRLQQLLLARAAELAEEEAAAAPPMRASSELTPSMAADPGPPPAVTEESAEEVESPGSALDPAPDPAPDGGALSSHLWLAFEGRGFPQPGTWPLGLRGGASFRIDALTLGLDLGASFASADHPAGKVEVWAVTAALVVGARWQPIPELGVTPNLRVDLGYVGLTGFSAGREPQRGQGASVALLASLRVEVALTERLGLLADLDLGSTLAGNIARTAAEEDVAGVSGLALALRIGLAFRL